MILLIANFMLVFPKETCPLPNRQCKVETKKNLSLFGSWCLNFKSVLSRGKFGNFLNLQDFHCAGGVSALLFPVIVIVEGSRPVFCGECRHACWLQLQENYYFLYFKVNSVFPNGCWTCHHQQPFFYCCQPKCQDLEAFDKAKKAGALPQCCLVYSAPWIIVKGT